MNRCEKACAAPPCPKRHLHILRETGWLAWVLIAGCIPFSPWNPQPSTRKPDSTLSPDGRWPQTPLVCSVAKLDLGTLPQGARREAAFWLSNPGSEAVEVTGVRTSCDC